MPGNSIINIGELAKPAEALINRISDAVGGIARPWQIRRVAKAEGDAAVILAESSLRMSEIQQRAFNRMANEEVKKQENIENITYKSIPFLKADAQPDRIETDWITDFFEAARKISNEQMQEIWSRILSEEANAPESVPKATITVLNQLGPSDAKAFGGLMALSKNIAGQRYPIIFSANDKIVEENGLSYDLLCHLQDIGLITFNNINGYNISGLDQFPVQLKNDLHGLTPPKGELDIGVVRLTFAGRQISRCITISEAATLDSYLMEKWAEKLIAVAPLATAPTAIDNH